MEAKQKGSEAFARQDYKLAAEYFELGIQECLNRSEQTDPALFAALYANKSAAECKLGLYREALSNAKMAIMRHPEWFRGYVRAAEAARHIDECKQQAATMAKTALHLATTESEREQCRALIPKSDEQLQQERVTTEFLSWLRASESKSTELSLLQIRTYAEGYRGVHAASNISSGKLVAAIPHDRILTTQLAIDKSPTVQAIVKATAAQGQQLRDVLQSSQSCVALYLLEEREKGDNSQWWPYIAMLPTSYRSMPYYFGPAEYKLLRGSRLGVKSQERKTEIDGDYARLVRAVPGIEKRFSLEDFVWARMAVLTRIFAFSVAGQMTEGLVPMADMLNHDVKKTTEWKFSDKLNAFTLTASRDMSAGDAVTDSYGRKCNSKLLVNYGFTLRDNPDNEAVFEFQCLGRAARLSLAQDVHAHTLDTFAHLREYFLVHEKLEKSLGSGSGSGSESKQVENKVMDFSDVDADTTASKPVLTTQTIQVKHASEYYKPLSRDNELRVLQEMATVAKKQLAKYPTSLEQDEAELAKLENDTSPDVACYRNCLVIAIGEKRIYHGYIRKYELVTRLLEDSKQGKTPLGKKQRKQLLLDASKDPVVSYVVMNWKKWVGL